MDIKINRIHLDDQHLYIKTDNGQFKYSIFEMIESCTPNDDQQQKTIKQQKLMKMDYKSLIIDKQQIKSISCNSDNVLMITTNGLLYSRGNN